MLICKVIDEKKQNLHNTFNANELEDIMRISIQEAEQMEQSLLAALGREIHQAVSFRQMSQICFRLTTDTYPTYGNVFAGLLSGGYYIFAGKESAKIKIRLGVNNTPFVKYLFIIIDNDEITELKVSCEQDDGSTTTHDCCWELYIP